MGHFSSHSLHPVHFSSSIYRAFCFRVTLKFPASPSIFSISARVIISISLCLPISTSFGAIIHIEQSFVGNVLSSCDIVPPIQGFFSTRYTFIPDSARSSAACIPPIPPPRTSTEPIFLVLSSIFTASFISSILKPLL